jgi:acetylornithine deacetylase
VDPLTQIRLTRELVDIDSTTGEEATAGTWLAATLTGFGYDVTTQRVAGDRFNILARRGDPVVVFSTHFDCVPPFFPSREAEDRLYGRGACDAKGILLAQVAAAERLAAAGETRVGLLYVVGEERGSEGARVANELASGSRFLVNGEPTGNRLALATRGVYRVRLDATGRAAHSSRPDLGVSAIDALIDALVALRGVEWPADPELGRTFYTTGMISGGIAPNVISPVADAELTFRTVGVHDEVRQLIARHVGPAIAVEDVLVVPPIRLTTVEGFETEVFSFTTDIPFLDQWGAPLLLGPGTVVEAHTDDEHVAIAELHRAVDLYERLARELLAARP